MNDSAIEMPFVPYQGNDDYIFESYAHDDEAQVYPELALLNGQGFHIWFDEGIGPGHVWPRELAGRIENCDLMLFFVTPASLGSSNCSREINFALENDKPVIAIHLHEVEIPSDWRFTIGDRQAILKYRLSGEIYLDRLTTAIREYVAVQDEPGVLLAVHDLATVSSGQHKQTWRRIALPVLLLIALAIPLTSEILDQRENDRWIAEEALPQLHALIEQDKIGAAYRLVETIDQRGGAGAVSQDIQDQIVVITNLATDPPGARASYRLYTEPADSWTEIGPTPLPQQRLPRDLLVMKFEKPGFESAIRVTHNPGLITGNAAYTRDTGVMLDPFGISTPTITLQRLTGNEEMIAIPETDFPIQFSHFAMLEPVHIPAYHLDRLEVSNADFQAFVDAGGYAEARYWQGLGLGDGWNSTVAGFTDKTGKPGPADWEFGHFPEGKGSHPVGGVSWYEAMAYAEFRGKSLPSVAHWVRGAVMLMECCEPLAPALIVQSNFTGKTSAVGEFPGVSSYGAYDMAGNVREWTYNEVGDFRAIMGGGHTDPPYVFNSVDRLPAEDRSSTNGFRLVRYGGDPLSEFNSALTPLDEGLEKEPSIAPDERFETFRALLEYGQFPVSGEVETRTETEGFSRQKVVLSASGGEDFPVYLWLPEHTKPPYDTIIYMGGAGGFSAESRIEDSFPWQESEIFDMLLHSGRAVAWPVYHGSYERYFNIDILPKEAWPQVWLEQARAWNRETGLTLDYLESRSDFTGIFGFLGLSQGALSNWKTLYYQPRLIVGIQLAGGLPYWQESSVLEADHQIHYLPRITTPLLMLNGRFDYRVSNERIEKANALLGTPDVNKRVVLYDAGHWPLPRNQMRREILTFLDKHLV